MKIALYAAITFFVLIFTAINFYIGLRGWQAIGRHIPFLGGSVYWLLYSIAAFSYIISRFVSRIAPYSIAKMSEVLGGYWMAAMLYFLILIVIIDIIRLIDHWTGFLPKSLKSSGAALIAAIVIISFTAALLAYGTWNAKRPQIRSYDVNIAKKAGALNKLHIVMVSDVHFGSIVDIPRLESMIDLVNCLKPDLVLMPGDIVDEDVGQFNKQKAALALRNIKSKYGVYVSFGNHEYFSGRLDEIAKYYHESGINVLRDSAIKVTGSFYLIGREDKSGQRFTGKPRMKLEDLIDGLDKSLPVILLDHQPSDLKESMDAGVDLQVCGHTHRGQLFPGNLITRRIFEVDWGYLRKGNLQVIVSSGFGTWGPPVRIGSTPEIVSINVNFTGP